MEYVDFLNSNAKIVHNQVIKAGYQIIENSPYCLMAKQILALHNGRAKKIYLCTQNLKNILVWSAPTGPRNVFAKSKVKQARFYMSKALTHEAVHAAQYCNNNNLIAPERSSPVVTDFKKEAIQLSLLVGGTKQREEEAYLLETNPAFVVAALKRFCF